MAMPWNEWLCRSKSQKLGAETMFQLLGPLPNVSHTSTRRFGSGNGSRLRRVVLIALKMVVLAPIPSASVRTATAVKPGFFANVRSP